MQGLGVDLGTTWTAAAVYDGKAVEPLKLGAAGAAMPSVVAIADGKPVAGDAAVRVGRDSTAAVAREFKRRLGDSTPIVLAGTPYGPETLTGHVLAHVVATAASAGHDTSHVTLAHPATWGEFKLDLLREAGRVAGIGDVALVPEPVAAAGHYSRLGRLSAGDAVVVYDFGGGTFDAAVVKLGADGPELLGRAEGLDRLGGVDLDQAVLAHVDAALDGALRSMDRDNPDVRRAALELRAECVAAKEALSADTETTIAVRFPNLNTDVRITRPEFEAAVRPRVADTLSALDRAIASASLSAGDLAGVVLVGGSSRIPMVAEQVAAHTGRPNLVDADPKLSVAFGAAEPDLRPTTTSRAAPAVVTTEPAMPDSPRPTPPSPPAQSEQGGGATADGAAAARPGAPGAPGGGGAQKPPQRTAPSERRTAAANVKKEEESGLSTAAKVAAGLAAAGAATAAGLLWGDQVTDALGITGDDDASPTDAAAAPADDATADDDSMDAFDAVAPAGGGGGGGGGGGFSGGGGGGGGFGGGGGGGGGGAFAPPRPQMRPQPDMAPPSGQPAADSPVSPEFLAARDQLQQRLADWQPPVGASPEEAAALRDRLGGLLQRFRPDSGQSTADAIAELRDEFEVRIDNFTQDAKLDALTEAQKQAGGGTTTGAPTDGSTTGMPGDGSTTGMPGDGSTTGTPADGSTTGTPTDGSTTETPTDGSDGSTTGTPTDGSTTETPSDGSTTGTPGDGSTTGTPGDGSTTETPSDGSTTETPTDGSTGSTETPSTGDAAFEARRQELVNELENWQPAPGMDAAAAEARRTELLQQVRQAQPMPGQSLDASFPPVRSDPLLFNTGVVGPQPDPDPVPEPTVDETPPPPDDAPAGGMPTQDDGDSSDAVDTDSSDAVDNPDPAVTLPNPLGETGLHTADGLPDGVQNLVSDASGLVDDFDSMAGIGDDMSANAAGDSGIDLTADVITDGPAVIPGADQAETFAPVDDLDVLGTTQVADAMDQPAMVDVAAAPTYDDPPPLDDLGLDAPVLVDDFTDGFAASAPDPEPVTFDEPDLDSAASDFADPEPEPQPVAVADDGSDDLGLN